MVEKADVHVDIGRYITKATKNDNNGVLLHIDAPVAEGKVAAGAYAGVQAGSALLASFALFALP